MSFPRGLFSALFASCRLKPLADLCAVDIEDVQQLAVKASEPYEPPG